MKVLIEFCGGEPNVLIEGQNATEVALLESLYHGFQPKKEGTEFDEDSATLTIGMEFPA